MRIGIVLFALLSPMISFADGAVLYLAPESGTYAVGQDFQERVLVDSGGSSINAAEANIRFDPSALAVDDISTEGSILDQWPTKPQFSNASGTVRFTGSATQNFTGQDGLLVTITFRALRDIDSSANLAAGAVLAADGQESNIVTSMQSAAFSIQPDSVVPPAPDQTGDTTTTSASTSDATTSNAANATSFTQQVPTLDQYQQHIDAGQYLIVRGTAAPDSSVHVSVQRGDGSPSDSIVQSGIDGSFTFVSDQPVEEGVYTITAQTRSNDGEESPVSDPITITASTQGLAASAELVGNLAFDLLPYVALVMAGALALTYMRHRHKMAALAKASGRDTN